MSVSLLRYETYVRWYTRCQMVVLSVFFFIIIIIIYVKNCFSRDWQKVIFNSANKSPGCCVNHLKKYC